MTSHAYYKDRLGFDPNEVQYECSSTTSTSRRSATRHYEQHQYLRRHHQSTPGHLHSLQSQGHGHGHGHGQSGGSVSPTRISISPGGPQLPDQYQTDTSPAKRAKHSSSSAAATTTSTTTSHRYQHQQHRSSQHQSQGAGYEDALTQFKGTMSVWEYFIENCDLICK